MPNGSLWGLRTSDRDGVQKNSFNPPTGGAKAETPSQKFERIRGYLKKELKPDTRDLDAALLYNSLCGQSEIDPVAFLDSTNLSAGAKSEVIALNTPIE